MSDDMQVNAFPSWYGSDRTVAARIAKELSGCDWVGIGFAGGMSIIPHLAARTVNVNDIHRHAINMANVCGDPVLGPKFYRAARRKIFHPDQLKASQQRCIDREIGRGEGPIGEMFRMDAPKMAIGDEPNLAWAIDYAVVSGMIRHASAGTPAEFKAAISTRWNAGGGDSSAHYHNWVMSFLAWRRIFRKCNFTTMDVFDFIDRVIKSKIKEAEKAAAGKEHSILGGYFDPPFPGAGDKYTHRFTMAQHKTLSEKLSQLHPCRVCIRFYDHAWVREFYPESIWTWIRHPGRKQTNESVSEVLLINGDAR